MPFHFPFSCASFPTFSTIFSLEGMDQGRGEQDADKSQSHSLQVWKFLNDFRPEMICSYIALLQMPLIRLPRLIGAKLDKVTGNVELLRQFFNAWLYWANPEANSGWLRFLGGKLANHTSHHLSYESIHYRYQICLMSTSIFEFTPIQGRRSMATLRKMQ